jgi:uncharacterized protein YhhL (DUF1145 family)
MCLKNTKNTFKAPLNTNVQVFLFTLQHVAMLQIAILRGQCVLKTPKTHLKTRVLKVFLVFFKNTVPS